MCHAIDQFASNFFAIFSSGGLETGWFGIFPGKSSLIQGRLASSVQRLILKMSV